MVAAPEGGERGDFGVAFSADLTVDELAHLRRKAIVARGGTPSTTTGRVRRHRRRERRRNRRASPTARAALSSSARGAWLEAMIDAAAGRGPARAPSTRPCAAPALLPAPAPRPVVVRRSCPGRSVIAPGGDRRRQQPGPVCGGTRGGRGRRGRHTRRGHDRARDLRSPRARRGGARVADAHRTSSSGSGLGPLTDGLKVEPISAAEPAARRHGPHPIHARPVRDSPTGAGRRRPGPDADVGPGPGDPAPLRRPRLARRWGRRASTQTPTQRTEAP